MKAESGATRASFQFGVASFCWVQITCPWCDPVFFTIVTFLFALQLMLSALFEWFLLRLAQLLPFNFLNCLACLGIDAFTESTRAQISGLGLLNFVTRKQLGQDFSGGNAMRGALKWSSSWVVEKPLPYRRPIPPKWQIQLTQAVVQAMRPCVCKVGVQSNHLSVSCGVWVFSLKSVPHFFDNDEVADVLALTFFYVADNGNLCVYVLIRPLFDF